MYVGLCYLSLNIWFFNLMSKKNSSMEGLNRLIQPYYFKKEAYV